MKCIISESPKTVSKLCIGNLKGSSRRKAPYFVKKKKKQEMDRSVPNFEFEGGKNEVKHPIQFFIVAQLSPCCDHEFHQIVDKARISSSSR